MNTKTTNLENNTWNEIERKFIIPKLIDNIEEYEKKRLHNDICL